MTMRYFPSRAAGGELELVRRGFEYGWVKLEGRPGMPSAEAVKQAWAADEAIMLPGILADALPKFQTHIALAHELMERAREGEELSELLEATPYAERLQPAFELSGAGFEEHDDQGIEKVFFDAWQDDDIVADNLWCKASWLSLDEEEGSVRFRFSYGIEGYEDVAADLQQELWAGRLCDALFPESAAVTGHAGLNTLLARMLDCREVAFVERIVYFNAPNGGALMHHDVERGHEGVVFAQMSGSTFWLALSKPRLMDEIDAFLAQAPEGEWAALRRLAADREALAAHLDDPEHELAELLLDGEPAFCRQLIERGHAYVLQPGDVLLMPQRDLASCVWHAVICLGDEAGEGLSFALRRLDA